MCTCLIFLDHFDRNLVTKADLESLIRKNSHVVKEIAAILDKNGTVLLSLILVAIYECFGDCLLIHGPVLFFQNLWSDYPSQKM